MSKSGDGELAVRNISADPEAMPTGLMPRRPQPPASDKFGKGGGVVYVEDENGSERGARGRSGRYLPRRDGPIPAGSLPGPDELHNARLRRSDREHQARDKERERNCPDWSTATAEPVVGHMYPLPIWDGSAGPAYVRPEFHGRIDGRAPRYPQSGSEIIGEFDV